MVLARILFTLMELHDCDRHHRNTMESFSLYLSKYENLNESFLCCLCTVNENTIKIECEEL